MRKLEISYEVTPLIGSMTVRIMEKYIVFGPYDEVKVQKVVMCLSALVGLVQYVNA